MGFTFRPFQKEAFHWLKTHTRGHLICLAPTGSGKSMIFYQYVKKHLCRALFFTPLLALGRQQQKQFLSMGVDVFFGMGSAPERPVLKKELSRSQVWITSPERFFAPEKKFFLKYLKKWNPDLLIVDECHCFWDWGEGFRPAFEQLPKVLSLGVKQSLWLSATLSQEAKHVLLEQLPEPKEVLGGFSLPEKLFFQVMKVSCLERRVFLMSWIRFQKNPGMVFVPTRKMAEKLWFFFQRQGIPALFYHAGLSHEERLGVEKQMREKKVQLVLATSAFGMGMDYHFLKWVVLWGPPFSLLHLAQSIGRVGRSGQAGRAFLLWNEVDFSLLEWGIHSERKKREWKWVQAFLGSRKCRRVFLKNYFDGTTDAISVQVARNTCCDICLLKKTHL